MSTLAGLKDDQISIFGHQGLELLVIAGMQSHHGGLISRNVAAHRSTLFAALKVIIRAARALANDTEFARLHLLDLGDLLENLRGEKLFHGHTIYIHIYYTTK